jgi:hypothetical protein
MYYDAKRLYAKGPEASTVKLLMAVIIALSK